MNDDVIQLTNADESGFSIESFCEFQRLELTSAEADERFRAYSAKRSDLQNRYSEYGEHGARGMSAFDQAISNGHSLQTAELAAVRGVRPSSPGVYVQHEPGRTSDVLEAALLYSLGANEKFIASQYGPKVTDAATGKNFRGIGLHDVIRRKLASDGQHAGIGRLSEDSIRTAFMAGTGPSTYSVPYLLSNVANKLAMMAFNDAGVTWRTWCRTSSVNDFKERTGLRIVGSDRLAAVPRGGEVKHGTIAESRFTNQADTYGQLLGFDRRDLINDDLSLLATVPAIFGRAASIAIERQVYVTLIGNAGSFFASGNKNYSSGAGSTLTDAGLTAALQLFGQQTDPAGNPTFLRPTILLVPPALWRAGRSLTVSTGVTGSTTANTLLPSGNVWADMFTLVEAPYLANSAGLSGVDTSWYLFVSPGDFSCVDVAFLQGKQTPTVESFDFDPSMLGLTTRVYLDFGCALMEPRGGVLSVGA